MVNEVSALSHIKRLEGKLFWRQGAEEKKHRGLPWAREYGMLGGSESETLSSR